MVKVIKNFCFTHHFVYEGKFCPFCTKERNKVSNKHETNKSSNKPPHREYVVKERPITVDQLEKLKAKFNSK